MKRKKSELATFSRGLHIISTLAQVIAKGNKEYGQVDLTLKIQTLKSLKLILNSKGIMVSELNRLGIDSTKENANLVKNARIVWRKLKEREYKKLPAEICSLSACYQA
ncbi:MAG: hypothetical protein KAI72_09815 [Candidatus Pacebacteria bacterium]|nr:hypothetical protein [Candidatus Paceibacterota bacterium]